MNELIIGLEAMIRRIVAEEVATIALLNRTAAPTDAEAEAMVKKAIVDKPWFDEYLASEVATAVDTMAISKPIVDDELMLLIKRTVQENAASESRVYDIVTDGLKDLELLDDEGVKEIVRNMDHDYSSFNEQVEQIIEGADFSIRVSC